LNVYHGRNKTGRLKKWHTVNGKGSWALEVLEGVNVSGTEKSITVEPVYRRLFSMDERGPLIIEAGGAVIGLSTRWPFVVIMKDDPDFMENR